MVSFARLLAAASDLPDSSQGASRSLHSTPSSSHWLEKYALSSQAFEAAFDERQLSDPCITESLLVRVRNQDSPTDLLHSHKQRHPSIPVDQLLYDLGPESTTAQNFKNLKQTLAGFNNLNETDIARSFVRMFSWTRDLSELDSEAMPVYQLFCLFTREHTTDRDLRQDPKDIESTALKASSWDFDNFVSAVIDVLSDSKKDIDWNEVVRGLDCPELHTVLDLTAFISIAKAYAAGTNGKRIPATCFVKPWRKMTAQTAMLTAALAKPDLVDWECIETIPGASAEESESPYSRVDLVCALVDLNATHLLNVAVMSHPSLMLLTLSRCQPSANGALMQSHLVQLLTKHISSFPASSQIMRRLWHFVPALIAGALLAMWRKDTNSANLVVDIGIDLQCLPEILLPTMPLEFVFHVGMLAYKRQSFAWESVLLKYFSANGPTSLANWCRRLAEILISSRSFESFSVDAVRIMFRSIFSILQSSARQQEGSTAFVQLTEEVKQLHEAFSMHDPRVSDLQISADLGKNTVLIGSAQSNEHLAGSSSGRNDPAHLIESTHGFRDLTDARYTGVDEQQFSKDVEETVNRRFHDLYKGTLSIEQAIEVLRSLQISENSRDRKIFACMIHTLFDEYRFFKKYPDKELKLTGQLFGALVQYSIFDGETLQVALERVLDALQQGGKGVMGRSQNRTTDLNEDNVNRMAKFGLCALDRFRMRLHEWPQYCSRILQLAYLRNIAPELCREIEGIVSAAYVSMSPGPPAYRVDADVQGNGQGEIPTQSPPRVDVRSTVPTFGLASPSTQTTSPVVDATPHRSQSFEIPDARTFEIISFIFNNLSLSTIEEKKNQLVESLKPIHFPFFIDYVVVKRALVEPNHHELYIEFLDRLSPHIPNLFPLMVDKSFESAKALLASEKIVTNTNDRILLRTLGAWIGSLTLGRNKPILSRDLDLKKLCLEAFSKCRLTPVVPFVAKVLQGSKESKVFGPSNPWLKGILSLLQEISNVEDLKLNIKFEPASLLRALSIEPEDVVPSTLLQDLELPSRNNPDRRNSPQRSPRSPSASPDIRAAYANIRNGTDTAPNISVGVESVGMLSSSMGAGLSAVQSSALPSQMNIGMHVPASTSMNAVIANDTVPEIPPGLSGGMSGMPRSMHSGTGGTTSIHHGVTSNPSLLSQNQAPGANGNDPLVLPNFSHMVNVSSSIGIFQASPSLKSLLPIAIDRALKDIIQPVVERSCAIASLTTRELTLKDFENESSMSKIRKAALQMVQQLAGSLALVTCKEPLRVSMGNHVRTILASSATSLDPALINQAASLVCAANLDLGCHIIEKAAKDKAARELNEVIAGAFSTGRRPTPSVYAPGGPPGPEVFRVYSDFSRLPRTTSLDIPRASAPQQPYHSTGQVGTVGASNVSQQANIATLQPVHGIEISTIPTTHGLLPSDRLHEARYVADRELHYGASTRQNNQAALHGELSSSASDIIGQSAPMSTQNIEPAVVRTTENRPQSTSRSPLVMAPPAVMAAAMSKALQALNSSQSSRLQQNSHVSAPHHSTAEKALSTPQVLEKFNTVYANLLTALAEVTDISSIQDTRLQDLPVDHSIHQLWTEIPAAVKRSVTADEASMAVAQKVFKGLYEGDSSLHREVHVHLLDGLRESCRRLSKELVIWLAYSEEHKKLNRDCILALLKAKSLINVTSYDELLSKAIDGGRNTKALDFSAFLVQKAVIEEHLVTSAEFMQTLDTMAKIAKRSSTPALPSAPGGLASLVEEARRVPNRPSHPSASGDSVESQSSMVKLHKEVEHPDPTGSREWVTGILTEWQRLVASDTPQQHVVTTFLGHIRSKTMNNEELRERFCRLAVEMVVAVTSTALQTKSNADGVSCELSQAPYTAVESTVRLISALCLAESTHSNDSQGRSSIILSSFLSALVKNILKNSDCGELRPQYQLFVGLLNEVSNGVAPSVPSELGAGVNAVQDYSVDPAGNAGNLSWSRNQAVAFLDAKGEGLLSFARRVSKSGDGLLGGDGTISISNYGVLVLFAGALKACGPRAAPGFAFCWLQLISNRNILPRLLNSPYQNSWSLFRQLLVSMINFLRPHLQCPPYLLKEHIKHLYRGTLRVLLVLLHDFPKFLVDYHFALCDAIPFSCIQMRNLVLAAFPKDMRLPDPFRPELQPAQIPEMALEPRILSDYTSVLVQCGAKNGIDSIIHSSSYRGPHARVSDIISSLFKGDESDPDKKYNIPAVHAFVFYVGRDALSQPGHSSGLIASQLHTKFLQRVLMEIDSEGQYHMLNVIANQLRYPNSHTNYFSCLLLYLFRESSNENIKEQITRVLVERLIANRPHPWGLLVTFIDLIKNPVYNFWRHGFVRCAPQIENLFENVARFCIGPALQHNPVPAL